MWVGVGAAVERPLCPPSSCSLTLAPNPCNPRHRAPGKRLSHTPRGVFSYVSPSTSTLRVPASVTRLSSAGTSGSCVSERGSVPGSVAQVSARRAKVSTRQAPTAADQRQLRRWKAMAGPERAMSTMPSARAAEGSRVEGSGVQELFGEGLAWKSAGWQRRRARVQHQRMTLARPRPARMLWAGVRQFWASPLSLPLLMNSLCRPRASHHSLRSTARSRSRPPLAQCTCRRWRT